MAVDTGYIKTALARHEVKGDNRLNPNLSGEEVGEVLRIAEEHIDFLYAEIETLKSQGARVCDAIDKAFADVERVRKEGKNV